ASKCAPVSVSNGPAAISSASAPVSRQSAGTEVDSRPPRSAAHAARSRACAPATVRAARLSPLVCCSFIHPPIAQPGAPDKRVLAPRRPADDVYGAVGRDAHRMGGAVLALRPPHRHPVLVG